MSCGAHIGIQLRGPLDVLQRELELLHRRVRIAAHLPAGVDDRVFHFAAQHLAEHTPPLLHFVEQLAFPGKLVGERTRLRIFRGRNASR